MFKISEMVQWRVIVTDPRVAEEVIRASESVMSGHIANDEVCSIWILFDKDASDMTHST